MQLFLRSEGIALNQSYKKNFLENLPIRKQMVLDGLFFIFTTLDSAISSFIRDLII
jgi:hypothetical protein